MKTQIWTEEEIRLLERNLDEDIEVLCVILPNHSINSIYSKRGWLRKMIQDDPLQVQNILPQPRVPKKKAAGNYRMFRDLDNAIGWAKEQPYAVIVDYTYHGTLGNNGRPLQHEYEVRNHHHPDFDEERYQRQEFLPSEIFYKTPKSYTDLYEQRQHQDGTIL